MSDQLIWVAAIWCALAVSAVAAKAQSVSCPAQRTVVDIPAGFDHQTRMCLRKLLISSVQTPNTIVRMGPNVVFDFSDVQDLPIELGRCVTLTSVADFGPPFDNPCIPIAKAPARAPAFVGVPAPTAQARTSNSPGPLLSYGKPGSHPDLPPNTAFFEARCTGGFSNDGVRVSGFQLFGPTLDDQETNEVGLRVQGCLDVEVSNMEVAGWGGAGVEVQNPNFTDIPDTKPNPVTVLIHDSYFHDNRHPSAGRHAEGYGVNTGLGGWSRIFNNLFDNNRHDIAAHGKAGGYDAQNNLLLKGGGYHGEWYEAFTHVIDAHGTGCWWSDDLCGEAGRSFLIKDNVVQYTRNSDIHIRGKPRSLATIDHNFFARSDQDAAIDLYTTDNVDVKRNNHYGIDDFGKYAVCDLDGDGIDDLFFATGVTWWMSGQGRFPWTFLSADELPMQDLRFGYFDGDQRCDVLAELPSGSGQWFISSGGVTDPFAKELGSFGHPLNEVVFGRFDPSVRDHRPGVTRQTTHAFRRRADGQWFVTPLAKVDWEPVQSSSFPLSQLRFGDFTGDGVTDVLAVVDGHWAISQSARGAWQRLNPTLGDPVENLYIVNMDTDDNIDDILKLDRKYTPAMIGNSLYVVAELTWWRSKNGVEPWKVWKTHTRKYPALDDGYVPVGYGFAGRFGPAPGQGATMVIDENRNGQFAADAGATIWVSRFQY